MGSKGHSATFISASTAIEGEMQLAGTAFVAGALTGKIRGAGLIKIEFGGEITGEVSCDELRVCGVFRGKVRCNKLVIVSSGVVEGEVLSHQLEIYEGGQFIGQRLKNTELDHLPDLLQTLAPDVIASNAKIAHVNALYASEPKDHRQGVHKWLSYGAAAVTLITVAGIMAPTPLTSWFTTLGQAASTSVSTEPSPPVTTESMLLSPVKDDSLAPNSVMAAADNESQNAALITSDKVETSSAEHHQAHTNIDSGAAMEDLAQMEQGHAQMLQQGNASDVPKDKL
ncbi:bactofilin family protein [Shewanella xiamenensis]|uniref:bactofilin family protein n=1 Tax=Shewanella xiamenensis TaxID=332186 RepID=UPI001C4E8A15|nr:polymer-forming cytoskeletal protein [Shewanella xiamenensis]MBW0280292.1 hypothetical protein [Shewanella xiamenensis]MCT8872931.1 polymer-forming cytoskeletal protein [Shewanella xiamenensis]UWH42996.1 polymer-forming cytoskeletal protein [Shewanella xiamenensis]